MESIKCLILGSISKEKGYARVIEVLEKNKKIELTIAGPLWNPLEKNTLRDLLEKEKSLKNLHIVPKKISERQLKTYAQNADVLLFPYLTTSQSGMFFRLVGYLRPIIAWKLSFFEEIEKDYGACVTVGNVKELEEEIMKITKSKKIKKDLINGAKRLKKDISWDQIAKKHIELYSSCFSNL